MINLILEHLYHCISPKSDSIDEFFVLSISVVVVMLSVIEVEIFLALRLQTIVNFYWIVYDE